MLIELSERMLERKRHSDWAKANPSMSKRVVGKTLYPKPPRKRRDKSQRRWRVEYDLAYDGGGDNEFTCYYRTKLGALIAAFFHQYIRSWGGSVVLFDQVGEKI